MKKLIFVDMDDCTADYQGQFLGRPTEPSEQFEPGFFRKLKPVAGALVGVRKLIAMGYEVQILTQPVAESSRCYTEKAQWIAHWFPELVNKINMTQDKSLVLGDYLIDDNEAKWKEKFESHGGKFVHFKYQKGNNAWNKASWQAMVLYFEAEKRRNGLK